MPLLFVGVQRIESGLIVFWHILDVCLTFNLSCVFVQRVRFHQFRPLISLPKHDRCNPLRNSLVLVGAQRIEMRVLIYSQPYSSYISDLESILCVCAAGKISRFSITTLDVAA